MEICQIYKSEIFEEIDGWWWMILKVKMKNWCQGGVIDYCILFVGCVFIIVKCWLQGLVNGYLFMGWKGEVWEQKNVGVVVYYYWLENESRLEV